MGLSASQARLLSITRRLNNNELQSEFIANSKIQLSSRNIAASEKYIEALDATKLNYISYNDSGVEQTVALTFNALNNYDPLKNQYAIYNAEGQLYVSATDAANFKAADTLYDFLALYDLFDQSDAENDDADAAYKADLALWEQEREAYYEALKAHNDKTNAEWQQYLSDKAAWEQEQWNNYYASPEYHNYQTELAAYELASQAGSPYDTWVGIVGTSDNPLSCYSAARNDPLGNCYRHVLGYLINPGTLQTFPTSVGDSVDVSSSDVSGSSLSGDGRGAQLAPVHDMMALQSNGEYIIKCDGDDDLNSDGQQNSLQTIIDAGGTPSKLDQLLSDYIYDSTTNTATEVKPLMQKAIDMMYIIKHQSEFGSELTADKMLNVLDNFTDGDMKNLTTPPTPPPEPDLNYPQPEPTFEEVLRDKPQKPIDTDRIYDKPKAQWYTNLWYAMNGQSTSDEVYSVYDENAEFSYFTVTDTEKTCDPDTSNQNYVVIDDTLASDSSWLQFALTNGMVTISQTVLKNDTNSTNIRWEGIEFTSTSDITEVADDSKIATAEAEYEKTMQEIQIEDKKLEQQMTKLDTEHSALEKELESIKGVMDKNTERSFAAFS